MADQDAAAERLFGSCVFSFVESADLPQSLIQEVCTVTLNPPNLEYAIDAISQ